MTSSETDAIRAGSAAERKPSAAFTLIEMMVAITIIAVVAVLAAPIFNDAPRLRLIAASTLITSDIELAQVMSISYPQAAVMVRFDPSGNRYWLAYAYDSETPIPRPDTGEPYEVILGQGRASSATGVAFTVRQMDHEALQFNAQGGLMDFSGSPAIELTSGDQTIRLLIAPSTGSITQVDGTASEPEA